jgi:ribosomal protein S18 acetylase RimI-like enzyme
MLPEQMIERCRGKYEFLELEVFAANQIARHFYTKYGFKPYGLRTQSCKRDGEYFDEDLTHLRL